MVYRVNDLEATSKKIADFCGAAGIVQLQPGMADPLGMWCKDAGINAGLNRAGDLCFALLDPNAAGGSTADAILILVPVSDYQAFLSNFAGATTDGDVTTVHFKNATRATYVAHWGDYAAASPYHDLVAKQPTTMLAVGALAQKELDTKDFVALVNVKGLRMMAIPQIEKLRIQASQQIDQQAASGQKLGTLDMTKFAPVAKVLVNQVMNLGEEFLNDMDDATASANISTDGIGDTMIMDFRPDSKLGQVIGQSKMTDASLLDGLPDGKYLMYGGSISSPQQMTQLLTDFVDPIEQSISTLGPDFASINTAIDGIKTLVQAQTGSRFGLMAPSGTLGQDPLLQAVAINTGDAKAMLNATHTMTDAYQMRDEDAGTGSGGGVDDRHRGGKDRGRRQLRRIPDRAEHERPNAPADAGDAVHDVPLRPKWSDQIRRRGE